LEIKKDKETLIAPTAVIENSTIIAPCYIGEHTKIVNAVVGPHVSLEAGSTVSQSVIAHSIIGSGSSVNNSVITNSLIGNHVNCHSKPDEWSLGDYSFID
jgi:Nucleoside-diphosphate-sugar pyrophosphorylase involved in lipopolysaccharide biosynthesis/translation initiation factor 2B, gamma/epsilon subunits (eIF-2Bgamma/eIF-2Bepsilon)